MAKRSNEPAPRAGATGAISACSFCFSRWSAAGAGSGTTPPARRKSPSTAGARARPRPAASINAARRASAAIRSASRSIANKASALFRSNQPPVEIKTSGMLIAAQIYQPNLLITEFHGPLTIADPGKAPTIVANWKLGAVERARHAARRRERVSLVFDSPEVDRINGGKRENAAACQAHRNPRPHRRRLGDQPSGHRDRDAAEAGGGAHLAPGRIASARRRHRRACCAA